MRKNDNDNLKDKLSFDVLAQVHCSVDYDLGKLNEQRNKKACWNAIFFQKLCHIRTA